VASSGPVPRYRAEVVFTFDLAALADGGRRLHELSSAADSVGFSLERARVDEAPPPAVSTDGWTAYAPLGPETAGMGPPGGEGPAALPSTGEPPSPGPDPADPGPPITVRLDELLLGDLGNQRVDARLLQAILLRDRRVAEWLRSRGIDADAVEDAFPGTHWR
jgi:hypothetical protein